jgi:hypothetical protein
LQGLLLRIAKPSKVKGKGLGHHQSTARVVFEMLPMKVYASQNRVTIR